MTNIFFPKEFEVQDIRKVIKRHFDAFNAIRLDTNGYALISMDSQEIQLLLDLVELSPKFQMVGQDDIRLEGTTIIIPSLIISSI